MAKSDLDAQILKHVTQASYQPVKPRVIAKQLGLRPSQMATMRQSIKRLVGQGRLRYGPKHLVIAGQPTKATECIGQFRRTSGGYGFVRPTENVHSRTPDEDIYIPANKTRDAADGDTVLVQFTTRRSGPRLRTAGEIQSVVRRRTHQFVGTYFEEAGQGYAQIDGSVFDDAIPVNDARASRARTDDRVVVEIVRFPSAYTEGEAIITEILGPRSRPGVDTLTIMREFGLPEAFPADVIQEARAAAERFHEQIDEDRRDLTDWTTITIDPEDARDFDDAISLQKTEQGGWRLAVHIADVSYFVQEGSLLDEAARERATSVYLPDRVIPMLPEILSNHLASLHPHRVRYTRTALIEFSPDGTRLTAEVFRSAIRSDRRLTYDEVDQFLTSRPTRKKELCAKIAQLLSQMHELAMLVRRLRMAAGSLEINMPKAKVVLDDNGNVSAAVTERQTESHQIIEEFMLAANMAVAEKLNAAKLPFLRRIHDEPSLRKIEALDKFVRRLRLEPHNLRDRLGLKELLAEVAGTPLEPIVNLAVLKSMAKAVYSVEALGHFALGSKCYCHFTSPIRRFPDLLVHRALDHLHSNGRQKKLSRATLVQLGEDCSEREQRAEKSERELTRLKLLRYFGDRVGEKFEAVITGIESYGIFVQCTEIPAEGLIPRERLRFDFRLDHSRTRLVNRRAGLSFQLGDLVEVEVSRTDFARREIDFEYLRHIRSIAVPTRVHDSKKPKARPIRKKTAKRRRTKKRHK